MELRPFIASYSGKTYRAIQKALTSDVLAQIARLANGPLALDSLPPEVVVELVAMRIASHDGDLVRLDTALFTRADLAMLLGALEPLSLRLAKIILAQGAPLADDAPLLALFFGGVIGFVQGCGHALDAAQLGDDWRHTRGRYGRSKVDFSQVCDAGEAFGPDHLNKSFRRGERVTRVTIGKLDSSAADDVSATLGLTITREVAEVHAPTVQALRQSVASAYVGMQPELNKILARTTSGRQGVAPSRMSMHLFRYLRRLVAAQLDETGYFGDALAGGTAVVCYENGIDVIEQMLS